MKTFWHGPPPDLYPIENLWTLLKQEIYSEVKQYINLNSVWEAVVAAAQKVDSQQIKKLNDSMNGRLITAIEKKGALAEQISRLGAGQMTAPFKPK